jgi:hypothetical protein
MKDELQADIEHFIKAIYVNHFYGCYGWFKGNYNNLMECVRRNNKI